MPYYRNVVDVEASDREDDDPYNGYDEKNDEGCNLKYDVVYKVDETEREDEGYGDLSDL